MAKEFINSPLSLLLLLASLAVGIMGLIFTPRQEDPQISVPMVDVFFQYEGASSEQVASLAIDPLERLMSEIPGVKHVYSVSRHGGGMVTVQFEVGEKMETSLVKLYDKLMSNMDRIPPGVSRPMVKPKGVDDVPVVTITLWSHDVDDAALRMVALDVMQRLKETRNTSQSFIVGGRSEQLRIEVFPERLAGYGVSAAQVLPWSIIPDAIEWDEWKTYERHEGMFYSLSTLMGKIANSVTVPLSLIVLEMTGYQAGTSVQPDSALMGIRLLIGPIPAVLLTGGIIFAIFYPLSRKQHRKIVEELRLRRKARREKSSPALGAAPIVSNK